MREGGSHLSLRFHGSLDGEFESLAGFAGGSEISSLSSWMRGLKAMRVVPRAPNFSALRRVSSNFDRA